MFLFDAGFKPQLLVSMSSSSNRPAIEKPCWLADNCTIIFMGENPGEKHRLCAIDCRERELRALVSHP